MLFVACNCHAIGARDNFCDVETGQCLCVPFVHRRICEECRPGYYGFPYCRKCDCNDNAETCDNLTGECYNCQNYTAGAHCERFVFEIWYRCLSGKLSAGNVKFILMFSKLGNRSRAWCKTIVTSYIKWGSYNSLHQALEIHLLYIHIILCVEGMSIIVFICCLRF